LIRIMELTTGDIGKQSRVVLLHTTLPASGSLNTTLFPLAVAPVPRWGFLLGGKKRAANLFINAA
jgi:hypothetical protein